MPPARDGGIISMIRFLALDYVKQGSCNATCLGTVDTPLLQDRLNAFADPVQARKDFVLTDGVGPVYNYITY